MAKRFENKRSKLKKIIMIFEWEIFS
jgi:hypothetical protein